MALPAAMTIGCFEQEKFQPEEEDGYADCNDITYQSIFECIDSTIPNGWIGYFRTYKHSFLSPANSQCPNGSPPENFVAEPAGAAECSKCTCDLPQADCGAQKLSCWPSSDCSKPLTLLLQLPNDECFTPDATLKGSTKDLSCELVSPGAPKSKSCKPSSIDFPNKDSWSYRVDACSLESNKGGCESGKICMPQRSPDLLERVCIRRNEKADCPDNWPFQILAYDDHGWSDDRKCDPCTCDASSIKCASGRYTFFDDNGCSPQGDAPIIVDSNICTKVSTLLDGPSSGPTWSIKGTSPQPSGVCTPGGGASTGSVHTSQPVTFCCQD